MHEDLKKATEIILAGGIILYPTDTVWGLGCDATSEDAVQKIYDIKKRSDHKSMLVLLDNDARLTQYIERVPEIAWQLLEISVRPLTLIYPGAKNLAANLLAEDGSIGIRITSDRFCQQLIQKTRKPIVSTSANISGSPAPAIFDEIDEALKSKADYIVKYRQDDISKAQPSGIIKVGPDGEVKVIRE